MHPAEFEEWFQYYHEQPFGSKRHNMHAAIIASTLVNAFRSKGTRPINWKDFLFVSETEHREAALEQAVKHLMAIAVPKGLAKKLAKKERTRRRKERDRSRKTRRKARS